jgi:hypothetical protein
MADGDLTLTIGAALAERLRLRAEAAGQAVEDYVRDVLEGLSESQLGFGESDADWQEIDRIVDETERDGGIPLEDMERWMRSWGTDAELPPPEPRPRIRE